MKVFLFVLLCIGVASLVTAVRDNSSLNPDVRLGSAVFFLIAIGSCALMVVSFLVYAAWRLL